MAEAVIESPRERRLIQIEGGLVKVVRETIEKQVKLAEFMTKMSEGQAFMSGPLPRGCVFYARAASREDGKCAILFAIEKEAGMQSVSWKKQPETEMEQRHPERCIKDLRLSWPNTLWLITFIGSGLHKVVLAATKAPLLLGGLDTRLYMLPMPNQYANGINEFCVGNISLDINLPIEVRAQKLFDELQKSLWNHDLADRVAFANTGVDSLQDWHDKSAADPLLHARLQLAAHPRVTLGALVNCLIGVQAC